MQNHSVLPGFTYDPVKKRYFKSEARNRYTQSKVLLPEYLDEELSKRKYVKYIDDFILGNGLERQEWFNFQNRSFQLATCYKLPRSIEEIGVAQIHMIRDQDALMIRDCKQNMHRLYFDASDYSFQVFREEEFGMKDSTTFLMEKEEFCFRVNISNCFQYTTSSMKGTGTLSLNNVIDVSIHVECLNSSDHTAGQKVTGIVLNSRGYQLFLHRADICQVEKARHFPKSFGEATCCLLLSSKSAVIGFRNGNVCFLDLSVVKNNLPHVLYVGEGPIVSLTLAYTRQQNRNNIIVSVGKHPFQELICISAHGKLCTKYRTRFSNLSRNKELIYQISVGENVFLFYGKRYESKFDLFLHEDSNTIDPSNLTWEFSDNCEIIDILPYSRHEPLLLDRPRKNIRNKSILNVTFHNIVSYGFDNIGIFILHRNSKSIENNLILKEYHV